VSVEVARFVDVEAFALLAEPFLLQREAQNNLPLGIIGFLRDGPPTVDPASAYLGIGRADPLVVGVLIWTPGFRIVLSLPDDEAFGGSAGAAVHETGLPMMGVLGPESAALAFSRAWRRDGVRVREAMRQPIYRLSRRPEVPSTSGHLREAVEDDLELVTAWWQGFARDAEHHTISEDEARTIARGRIGQRDRRTYVWEAGRPVSMAVATGPTPHGIRIGGVYTPPELRGQGYATACVAALSRLQMEQGRQFCFLFTDAANPTSNAIYRRIGYEQVTEMVALDFSS
jgi:RimJ/RimL family protein N-acetyltransferase